MYKEITVKRKSNSTTSNYYIPLRENIWTLYGAGEVGSTGKLGDVIIEIKNNIDDNIRFFNDHDLMINVDISLYDYLYGNNITVRLPNNTQIPFELPSCVNRVPIFTIKNMGMPYNDTDDIFKVSIVNTTSVKRGDLYLYFKIKDIDNHKDIIKKLFSSIQN